MEPGNILLPTQAADKSARAGRGDKAKTFPPITEVARLTVSTEEAANALNRRPKPCAHGQ